MNRSEFDLFRSDSGACHPSDCESNDPSRDSYDVSSLVPGTLVLFSVRGYVHYPGFSRRSGEPYNVAAITKPDTPAQVGAVFIHTTRLTIGFSSLGTKSGWLITYDLNNHYYISTSNNHFNFKPQSNQHTFNKIVRLKLSSAWENNNKTSTCPKLIPKTHQPCILFCLSFQRK